MSFTFLTTLIAGLTLGIKHALDADHVVAVSTIVSDQANPLKAALVGALWGLGHTATLFLVGVGVIIFKVNIPAKLSLSFEFAVGLLLVILGIQTIWKYRRKKIHLHLHHHDGRAHLHFHAHETTPGHDHSHSLVPSSQLLFKLMPSNWELRTVLVGMVHGLAGSAALMLLVIGTIRSAWQGVLYILIFGVGSIAGMLAVSALIGLPFTISAERFKSVNRNIGLLAGVVSIVLGVFVMGEVGFVQGLIYKIKV
jgi:ABC-type nickel/cobalt efflux system permease component RcnA